MCAKGGRRDGMSSRTAKICRWHLTIHSLYCCCWTIIILFEKQIEMTKEIPGGNPVWIKVISSFSKINRPKKKKKKKTWQDIIFRSPIQVLSSFNWSWLGVFEAQGFSTGPRFQEIRTTFALDHAASPVAMHGGILMGHPLLSIITRNTLASSVLSLIFIKKSFSFGSVAYSASSLSTCVLTVLVMST